MPKRTCPRCGEVPRLDDQYFHRGFGALSRLDNKTYICSDCGVEEAMENFARNELTPKSQWPIRGKGN